MKKSIKTHKIITLLLNIFIPIILGFLVGVLSKSTNGYEMLIKPCFAPPSIVFPVVWTILYLLMGISAYIINRSDSLFRNNALKIYSIQLLLNLFWSFIFFKFRLILFGALWIALLIIFVIKMILIYKKIDKVASCLQIPYLFWLIYALILNLTIYFLN